MRPEFRGPLPLDERDFAEIRGRVVRKIERRPIFPIAVRFAFAAAAVIVLLFVLWPASVPPKQAPLTRPAATLSPPARSEEVPTPSPRVRGEGARRADEGLTQLPKNRKPVAVASSGAPPADTDMHIEIQTADPNVRIIWIAR